MKSEWVGWVANACILLVLFNCGLDLYPQGERLKFGPEVSRQFQQNWPEHPLRATLGSGLKGLRLYYGKGKEERYYLQYANLFTGHPADLELFNGFRGDLGWLTPLMIPEQPVERPLTP